MANIASEVFTEATDQGMPVCGFILAYAATRKTIASASRPTKRRTLPTFPFLSLDMISAISLLLRGQKRIKKLLQDGPGNEPGPRREPLSLVGDDKRRGSSDGKLIPERDVLRDKRVHCTWVSGRSETVIW